MSLESKQWQWSGEVWRFKWRLRVLRHIYDPTVGASDRWVVQPNLIYDCKQKPRR